MNRRAILCLLAAALVCAGCNNLPGKPKPGSIPVDPNQVTDFRQLFAENCAGCHGTDGKGGSALSLNDPVYLAVADDAALRKATSEGIRGSLMPAFSRSSGGMLTQLQVDSIVKGMRTSWAVPGALGGAAAPPYSASEPGDVARGAKAFSTFCASCHGPEGKGTPKGSSVVDGSFLALVSDQGLRTIVITGRPELGAPDWRGNVPGQPMSPQEITDVVAWLASQRPKYPGQPYPSAASHAGETK